MATFRAPPEAYTRIPTRTPAGTLALTRALIVAAGEAKGIEPVQERLEQVRSTGLALQAAWIAFNRPQTSEASARVYDVRLDRAWRAIHRRNHDWIDIDHPQRAERAEAIDAALFNDGLAFITLAYPTQWAESERRLQLIETDGLEEDLAELVGPAIVAELREAHKDYGAILGITVELADEGANQARIIDALRASHRALAAYARLVHALAFEGSDEAIERAEAQLAPIHRFRKLRAAAVAAAEGDAAPVETEEAEDAPLPEIGEGAQADDAA